MRVLFSALQAGNRSGTGSYVKYLLGAMDEVLAEEEVELHVLWPEALKVPFAPQRLHIHETPAVSPLRRALSEAATMKAAERRIAPDVVHFPASFLPLRWKGRRSVVTVHDCSFLRNPAFFRKDRSIYYRRALRWTAKRADGIIACSKATADDLTRFTGFPADRVHVVYEAPCRTDRPAAEVIEAAQKRYRLPEKYILYLGAIEPRKNLVRLVSAFERTADLHDAHLVVAGRKGWKYGASVRAARRSSCRKRIHLPGYVEDQDVAAVMSGAQAFAYVSLWEGFGLPVADAMALGVPVLTSSVSSMPEVAGRCAVLAEPESVDSIAQGLTRLMQSRELRRHLSEAGRERADEFDWTTAARQTVEAYRQTLS